MSSAKTISIRRVTNPSQLPANYSQTPGGTLFGTTPGGTRVVYERAFLLSLQQSPLSRTPPTLPMIPGFTLPKGSPHSVSPKKTSCSPSPRAATTVSSKAAVSEDEQFAMDI
ncbi:eukaryotic translation initiation factor 4E-binding protein 3-like isoform X1 [Varroa jacobsoni]|uniref:Eukaryotic translation initiation factor 4E binding protein n=1 Tax=Varroa destructor TaxID=109461 RepID=A0A7M7M7R9_VARDE|nr:eukaryotic translation initiation factor 4E-binding protein 3-like [Varroa destructor]XP_022697404.1 eukaryotic translation initiation factor 4E-binding protein 3-like isoform X1 [Varroa jacobsoni]